MKEVINEFISESKDKTELVKCEVEVETTNHDNIIIKKYSLISKKYKIKRK